MNLECQRPCALPPWTKSICFTRPDCRRTFLNLNFTMPILADTAADAPANSSRLPLSPCHAPTSHASATPLPLDLTGDATGLLKAPLEGEGGCGAPRLDLSASSTTGISDRTLAPSRLTVVTPVPGMATSPTALDSGELTTPADSEVGFGSWSRGSPVEDEMDSEGAAYPPDAELARAGRGPSPAGEPHVHRPLPSRVQSSQTLHSHDGTQDGASADDEEGSLGSAGITPSITPRGPSALTVNVEICSPADADDEEVSVEDADETGLDGETEEFAVLALLGLSRHVSGSREDEVGARPEARIWPDRSPSLSRPSTRHRFPPAGASTQQATPHPAPHPSRR